jgi:hypothetical protein
VEALDKRIKKQTDLTQRLEDEEEQLNIQEQALKKQKLDKNLLIQKSKEMVRKLKLKQISTNTTSTKFSNISSTSESQSESQWL